MMTNMYIYFSKQLQKHPHYRQFIKMSGILATYCMMVTYPVVLGFLFITHNPLLIPTIIKPLIVLVLVSAFRYLMDRPRPYDVLDIEPVQPHRKGQSMPSRHSACAIIIALCFYPVSLYLGIFMTLVAVFVIGTRLLGCLHFVSDIVVGIIAAIIIYII